MAEKQVLIDLNDSRSIKIAEALSNNTCKKILNILADNEMSATDISVKLNLPLNTITYNLDKLTDSGLIEPTNKFLWSIKGKKINTYRLSNKKIIITPKALTKGILPALIGSAIVTFSIYLSSLNSSNTFQKALETASNQLAPGDYAAETASGVATEVAKMAPQYSQPIFQACSSQPIWAWFLLGALTAILIYLLWNLISNKLKGGK